MYGKSQISLGASRHDTLTSPCVFAQEEVVSCRTCRSVSCVTRSLGDVIDVISSKQQWKRFLINNSFAILLCTLC